MSDLSEDAAVSIDLFAMRRKIEDLLSNDPNIREDALDVHETAGKIINIVLDGILEVIEAQEMER